jgi:hypothetical protein
MFCGRRVELFAFGHRFASLVVPDHRGDIRPRRHGDSVGPLRGNEHADRAVVRPQVFGRDRLNLLGRHLLDAVAVQEEQPPIALRGPIAQVDRDLRAVAHLQLALLQDLLADAVDFLLRNAFLADAFDRFQQRVADRFQRIVLADFGHLVHQAGIVLGPDPAENARSLLRFDQRLVQPPGRFGGQDVAEHLDGRELGVRPARHMVRHAHQAGIADAAQGHRALSVLRRFFGIGPVQFPPRPRDRTEVLPHVLQRFFGVEAACDHQHRVVGLVVAAVEVPQFWQRHSFDVAAVADRRLAVVVPFVSHRGHLLQQHHRGRVLAPLEFVPHHRHLRLEILAADQTVDHAVGFQTDRELEVLVAGRQRFEVIRAVRRRRPVEPGARAPAAPWGSPDGPACP